MCIPPSEVAINQWKIWCYMTCGDQREHWGISMFHQGSLYICSMSSQHQLLTRTFSISDRWALLFLSTSLFVLNRISTNCYWEVIDKDKTLREHWCTLSACLGFWEWIRNWVKIYIERTLITYEYVYWTDFEICYLPHSRSIDAMVRETRCQW